MPGPVRFDAFMADALYHPTLGYYASGRARIGRDGDFLTSVSTGPLFGRLLAREIAGLWEQLDRPDPFRVIEQGAHQGDLMADLIDALQLCHPDCASATRCVVVEPFERLTSVQRQRLANARLSVEWTRTLAELSPLPGVHVSNELIDAFPVRRLERTPDGSWIDLAVEPHADGLRWVAGPPGADLPEPVRRAMDRLPVGARTEWRPGLDEWFRTIGSALTRGAVLVLDYGYLREHYYNPGRTEGTLSAYRAHRRVNDPLDQPGATDLTAHVDFTGLAEAAAAAGFDPLGFTDQHHYLLALARPEFGRWEAAPDAPGAAAERRALQTLTHPGLMGADFHACLFGRGFRFDPDRTGFALRNRVSLLYADSANLPG